LTQVCLSKFQFSITLNTYGTVITADNTGVLCYRGTSYGFNK
jgi:hypothetical protein